MAPNEPTNLFTVWGVDRAPYGPVELPTLVSWVQDERVTADTWVFVENAAVWQRAAELPELKLFFGAPAAAGAATLPGVGLKPGALRRVKILAGLSDAQLVRFARAMEIARIPQWSTVVVQGDPGDAMYLILEGELRVRLLVGCHETTLTTLGVGEFFGEMSLFDHGPRSADVVANSDSFLLKISAAALRTLAQHAPDVATPFLMAVLKTVATRMRADNKRLGDSMVFAQAGGI